MMEYHLETPLSKEKLAHLRAGDTVFLSGVIYTARDAAHARLFALMEKEEPLPVELQNFVVYYAGPAPARPGQPVGSIGPTTAGRMDQYTPAMLEKGMIAMIGKGARTEQVMEAIRKNGAVYFGCIGGAGALAARCVTEVETVAYEDLGSEAIRRLTIREFPLTVLVDSVGGNLYESGKEAYQKDAAARGPGQSLLTAKRLWTQNAVKEPFVP